MTITYITGPAPENIPPIGTALTLGPHLKFKVEDYGDSDEIDNPIHPGTKAYAVQLHGALIVPAGSPMEVLAKVFKGKFEDLIGD